MWYYIYESMILGQNASKPLYIYKICILDYNHEMNIGSSKDLFSCSQRWMFGATFSCLIFLDNELTDCLDVWLIFSVILLEVLTLTGGFHEFWGILPWLELEEVAFLPVFGDWGCESEVCHQEDKKQSSNDFNNLNLFYPWVKKWDVASYIGTLQTNMKEKTKTDQKRRKKKFGHILFCYQIV